MKLYLISFVPSDTDNHATRTLFFVNALGEFKGLELYDSCVAQIGVPNAETSYHSWDHPHGIFRFIDSWYELTAAIESFRNRLATTFDCEVTANVQELTGDTRKWFLTVGMSELVCRCLGAIVGSLPYGGENNKRERLDKLVEQMSIRVNRNRAPFISWKGQHYETPYRYSYHKTKARHIGEAIAQSIRDGCDKFSEEFMPDYDISSSLYQRFVQAASAVLGAQDISLEIAEQYCDHWDYPNNTSEVNVGRGRYRSYCQCCVDDNDVVVETYDTGVLMLRDNAYFCDNNEEYYEHEPEDQYDDNDEDDDTDTSRLMSYRTNILKVLSKDDSFESSAFGEFHMGIELELATNGFVNEAVTDLRDQLGDDYIICKSDGSLPSGGVEIVTTPRGLADHIKRFKAWQVSSLYRAWNTGVCGMHVHLDSHAFTRMTLGKFIVFINDAKNAEFIRKIAGRHPHIDSQAQSYCAAEGQEVLNNPSKALKGKSTNRYYMVNTTCLRRAEAERLGVHYVGERQFDTVELRIFRASLKKERLLAQIEFTHAVVMFCRIASMRDLDGVSFLKWLKATDNRYPHLSDWYGIRRRVGAKNAAPTELICTDTIVSTD
jgi:hypothetical protein